LPKIVTAAGECAQRRFLEFFAASIRNEHMRRAYVSAVVEFLAWCEGRGVSVIADVKPLHVAGYIEALSRARSAPTAKQRLAAIRCLVMVTLYESRELRGRSIPCALPSTIVSARHQDRSRHFVWFQPND
jgi:site-specific recombinase XerD